MASNDGEWDAKDELSKFLHKGTVAEYESEFVILATRVTGISESLLTYYYITGLKPLLKCALLRSGSTNLGEAFFLARIMEDRFEAISGKKLTIEEKIDIVLSWPNEEAPHVINGYLDANEDIGVVEVSSAIDNILDVGKSNVGIRSKFSEFSENKESVEEVIVGGGEALGLDEYEPNRVISVLKDECGEFDDRLNEIYLDLSEVFVIRAWDGRDVFSGSLDGFLKWVYDP